MPKNLRFWTNVGLIAFAHILVIVGLIRWSRESKNPSPQSVVWLNGGGGDGLVTETKNLPAPLRSPHHAVLKAGRSPARIFKTVS